MTRGPLPKKAIALAREIALGRGPVLGTEDLAEPQCDLLIFSPCCTVYVHIRRIRAHVVTPRDFEREFFGDIGRIRRVPETPVTSREIWVLSPWNAWQYFRVYDDRIAEIRRDGAPAAGTSPPAPG